MFAKAWSNIILFGFFISPAGYFISESNTLSFQIFSTCDLPGSTSYVVRPFSAHSTPEIFDVVERQWKPSYSTWSSLPQIRRRMLLRWKYPFSDSTEVFFEIHNTRTGKIYTTNKVKVWESSLKNGL